MPVQDECIARFDEFENLLNESDERWRLLQVQLEEAEENFLEAKLDSLKKWFDLDEAEFQNWNVGSLRHSIRDRIQRIVFAPLSEKMTQRVGCVFSSEEREAGEAEGKTLPPTTSNLMEELLKYWEVRVKPLVGEARSEDEKLQKKIRKTEKDESKQGVIALNGDTKKVSALKRQRPAIWEATQTVLEKMVTPMKRIATFFSDEVSEECVARMITAVPAIVSRAICDYYYSRCTIDLEQLENWWKNTKHTLQQRANIWERLKEQEPRLLRNVEGGLEDVNDRRHRYNMYATFGGSEIEVLRELSSQKLEESVTLLATVVSEMHQRLRMIRDSALWRIVESVQGIHKELKAEAANVDVWPTVSMEEGVLALAEAIGCPTEESSPSQSSGLAMGEEDLCDATMAVLGRLEKFVGLSVDIKSYFQKIAPGCEGISETMDVLVSRVTELNEELLCLLDDPSPGNLQAWLEQWSSISNVDKDHRIEATLAALPLRRDNELSPEARRERRRWLALLRGVQVLLNQDAIRAWCITPLGEVVPGSPASWKAGSEAGALQEAESDDLFLSTPPSPRGVMLAPPGGGHAYQPPQRYSLLEGEELLDQGVAGVPMGYQSGGQSGWRPEASPTRCEEGSRPGTPGKFVDGSYVSLRPNSASMRLPPLPASSPSISPIAPSSLAKPVKKS